MTSSEERLRLRLSSIRNLPSPPLVFNELNKIINTPKTSVKDVAAIMSEDAAMSARVLRLANSAFYGARTEITNIKQAVLVLGLDAVKSLVLSSSVFDMFKSQKIDREYQENYWRHSLAVALAAKLVARFHKIARGLDIEVSFSAGLLHDIGKLIICCYMPSEHEGIRTLVAEHHLSDYQAEEQVTGFTHTLIGRMLAENWKLPQAIRIGIELHHFPQLNQSELEDYAVVIHTANYLAKRSFDNKLPDHPGWAHILPEVYSALSLNDDVIEAFSNQLREEYTHSSTFMHMALSG